MKLSMSNIGWAGGQDEAVYSLLKNYGFLGLEIAPTRIFAETPYDKIKEAITWAEGLKRKYGFAVSSMQSIWYGRQEKLFGTEEERWALLEYTKKAIDFAAAIACKNLVFGCPRNRAIPDGVDPKVDIPFFNEIGEYAYMKGVAIGMEANPPIYNTNYINDTISALELIDKVDSKGFLLNLDVGAMVQNGEPVEVLRGKVKHINHVHISEPGLKPIEKRKLHTQLRDLLEAEHYQGFVSVEMGKVEDIQIIEKTVEYVGGIMNG